MSNVTHIAEGQVWSLLNKARLSLAIGAVGVAVLLGGALPAEAAPLPVHPCTVELNRLLQAWNEAGFDMPSKPTQAIVHGRNGRVSSGPEVTYMASQLREAIRDCQHGDVTAVWQRVAIVSDRLHHSS